MTRIDAPERVPDWLLGGRVRRRVFERLATTDGWTARALAAEIDAGEATVFELFRALRKLEALDHVDRGSYRLADNNPVADAIRALLNASAPLASHPVDRPPSRRK